MSEPALPLGAPTARTHLHWVDGILLLAILGLLWSVLHLGSGMFAPLDPSLATEIDLSLSGIPYYAGRTMLRMWIAFAFSLSFAVGTGYLAAHNRTARAILLPAWDVLQSVPVLGFLSATVAAFSALFPHSLFGMECASVFAIFTGQTWNMCFAFYQSLTSIPNNLQEAASVCRLTAWQRFTTLELPASTQNLLWNAMLSFGGGWFFVVQSEAVTIMHRNIQLPGLGSLMATALERADAKIAAHAVLAMLVVILATDQLVWRPLLDWAIKFKFESTDSSPRRTSWAYRFLKRTHIASWLGETFALRAAPIPQYGRSSKPADSKTRADFSSTLWNILTGLAVALLAIALLLAIRGLSHALPQLWTILNHGEVRHILYLASLTLLRVLAMTGVASLLWIPVAIQIGQSTRAARFAQPLCQMAASFPVNMTFPVLVGLFVAHRISINWGSILLLALGTQWYLLFNVIAGSAAIPGDLVEAARCYNMKGWSRWKNLLLPAVFPAWVTGACTAVGGAWNASIVAEVATWGGTTLRADGLGAYIAQATESGNSPRLIAGIAVMSALVILLNKLVWRPLYLLAEKRFSFSS